MDSPAEEIFADALELAPGERDAFLGRACGEDEPLRREVAALLADAESADTFFAELSGGASGLPPRRRPAEQSGDDIGPYKLVQKLGEGGFGVVWMAAQERPIRRTVALKVIKAGMDSEEVLSRFEAERQALARMEHPNIARVLDAGATSDGRPYFAMELVKGLPITQFCDERMPETKDRLRLFVDVCGAVNHAHQKGVIHRDIKPSNVMVTWEGERPVVKVIDFGIAKAIEGRLAEHTLCTRIEQLVGTPAYMSPEQAALGSLDIDTRSDIYSLGALLYELLAGVAPFDKKTLVRAGHEEMRRIIREVEPARPSARITSLEAGEKNPVVPAGGASKRHRRKVASDLDWIVMKAIEKPRDRRYETAEALARDIERFIADQPVEAKPPTPLYLLRKFGRRHRAVLRVFLALLVLLLAGTATSTWLAIRARKAERLADSRLAQVLDEQAGREKALRDAEAVSNFIVEVFRSPHPEKDGRKVTAAEVLAGAEKDIPVKLAGQPARQILLKRTLADTYTGLGLYQDAIRLRKDVLKDGTQVAGESSSETLDDMSQLAQVLLQLGHYAEALDFFQREAELRKAQSPPDRAKLEAAEAGMVECLYRTGQHEKAEKLLKKKRPEPSGSPELAEPQGAEGETLRKQRAEAILQRLREISESLPAQDPKLLHAMRMASKDLYRIGEKNRAILIQKDLAGRMEDKFGPDHIMTIEEEEYLAFLYWRNGPLPEAVPLWKSVIERRRKLFGPEHFDTLNAEARYAQMRFFGRHFDEATLTLERVVPLLRKVAGPDHRATANAESDLARCYCVVSRTPEAVVLLKDCAPNMRDDSFIASLLADLLLWQGREEEYRAHRDAVLEWAWKGRNSMNTRPDIYERLVYMACFSPLNEEQKRKVREIMRLAAMQRAVTPLVELKESAGQQLSYGVIAYRLGDYEEARRFLGRSLELSQGKRPQNRSAAEIFLAMTRAAQGEQSAVDDYKKLRKTIPDLPSDEHPFANTSLTEGDWVTPLLACREADKLFGR